MMFEDKLSITLKALYDQNPWWRSRTVPSEFTNPAKLPTPFQRRDFYFLKNRLNEPEILAIIGPRQVGKTTMLYQLIEHLLRTGVDPLRVLFFSFDYPILGPETSINDVIQTYLTYILREPANDLHSPVYIFLDEIGRIPDWSRILKGWYDLKYKMKFTVANSSSTEVLTGASESLVGRIRTYVMMHLKFVDHIRFHLRESADRINQFSLDIRNAFVRSVQDNDPKTLFQAMRNARVKLVGIEERIKGLLNEYLLKDGYPGLLTMDLRESSRRLIDYLSLTLYKDIVRIFEVRNTEALENLIHYIAHTTPNLFSEESAAKTIGIDHITLENYIHYLKQTFLISTAEFYSKSRAKRIRKQDKMYLLNVGLLNAILGQMDLSLFTDRTALGKVVETAVYDHCLRLSFDLFGPQAKLFYWRSKQKKEIDIIIEAYKKPIPIEVGIGKDFRPNTLLEFIEEYDSPLALAVVEENLDLEDRILKVPLWLFLLMC